MNTGTSDRYSPLFALCGTTAFRLPPPPPGPRRPVDDRRTDRFGPIPDYLLCQYLCFDPSPSTTAVATAAAATSLGGYSHSSIPVSPPPHNLTDPIIDRGSSEPLFHDSTLNCHVSTRDFSASETRQTDFPDVDNVHEVESLPPCVVNYQASLHSTLEEEDPVTYGVGDSCEARKIPILLLAEIKELALWREDDVLGDDDVKYMVSVMTTFKNFALTVGYGERLLSHIKELALRHDGALDDNFVKNMVSVMSSFRHLAFSSGSMKNSRYQTCSHERSKKKQRNSEAKSNNVSSSAHFTRSQSSKVAEADKVVVDLDDYLSTKRKLSGKRKRSQMDINANLSSGCSE